MTALIILFSWITSRVLSDLVAGYASSKISPPQTNLAAVLAVMLLAIMSGEPWFIYAVDAPPLFKADERRVRLAVHIEKNTDPKAVIAVHAAGQIPYYAERKTIDLLGLNDIFIANGDGNGAFYPGHNKWNYEYSIGELKPDLVADNFIAFGGYIRKNKNYQSLPSAVFVRKDSLLVNIEGISLNDYR